MGAEIKKQVIKELGLLDLSGRSRCLRPCYISRHVVEEGKGGRSNPFHWVVNVGGYPILNFVIQFRGKAGKYFQVQVRHHHPSASIGPTATFVFASESGNLGPAGFEIATFNGLRPMLPEVDIVAFSDDDTNFDTVAATVYATVA
jgi:hypothetical protein